MECLIDVFYGGAERNDWSSVSRQVICRLEIALIAFESSCNLS